MTDDRMTIEEKYTSATHASDLKVEAEKTGAADVIIAAGWCKSHLGSALLRLHSEYDGASKPPGRATHTDVMILMVSLKSIYNVREQLFIVADKLRINRRVASDVLYWWLSPVCPTCHGQQREAIVNTPMLSDVVCPVCRGSGESRLPGGDAGRRIEAHMNDCLTSARDSIKKRLLRFL